MLTIQSFTAVSYVLQYYATVVPPGTHFPEVTVVGILNNREIESYDSNTMKLMPKIVWNNMSVAEDYYKKRTQYWQNKVQQLKNELKGRMKHHNDTGGVHTFEVTWCCKWDDHVDDHVNTGCDPKSAYDGKEDQEIHYNAEKDIRRLNLPNQCSESLAKYTAHARDTLERKVIPSVSMVQRNSSAVVCHATGFFPKNITMFWQKNGQNLDEDVELKELLPNHNGTFQRRSILNVSFDKLDKNDYTCVVQHSSLEKDIIRPVPKPKAGRTNLGIVVALVIFALVVGVICMLGLCCRTSGVSLEDREYRRELNHNSRAHKVSYSSTDRSVHVT